MSDSVRPSFRSAWILGGSLIVSAFIGAAAIGSFNRAGDDIAVTGSAKREVAADFVVWRLESGGQFPTQMEALRVAREGAARVHAFFLAQGFADSSLTVSAPMMMVLNEYINGNETGRINGYRVTQEIELRSAEVDKVSALAGDMGQLLDPGYPLVSRAPEYLILSLPDIRGSLTADATKDAQNRAEEILAAVGATPGRIKAVRVGVVQITRRNSTMVNDYGMYDTSDRQKEVTAVVRVTFAVK